MATASAVIAMVHAISWRGLSVASTTRCQSDNGSGASAVGDGLLDRRERVLFGRESLRIFFRHDLVADPDGEFPSSTFDEFRIEPKLVLDQRGHTARRAGGNVRGANQRFEFVCARATPVIVKRHGSKFTRSTFTPGRLRCTFPVSRIERIPMKRSTRILRLFAVLAGVLVGMVPTV